MYTLKRMPSRKPHDFCEDYLLNVTPLSSCSVRLFSEYRLLMIYFLSRFLHVGNSDFLGITAVSPLPPTGFSLGKERAFSLWRAVLLSSVLGKLYRGGQWTQIRTKCQQSHRLKQRDSRLSEGILGFPAVASYVVRDGRTRFCFQPL